MLFRSGPAAVIHDFLYSVEHRGFVPNPDKPNRTTKLTRKVADKVFLRAMKDCNVGFFRRRLIYSAVRVFGWVAYKKERNNV